MRFGRCVWALVAAGALCWQRPGPLAAQEPDPKVRPAHLAGSWYPGEAATLSKQIDDLLAGASPPSISGRPLAVISPHAGYRFSAPVAAAAYKCLRGHSYKRVIVLAFSHRASGTYTGVDVPDQLTAYETPLGQVPLDRQACDLLLKNPLFSSNPEIDRGEHSLELQLPFLQRALKDFTLVPLLVGRMSTQQYAEAATAIAPLLDGNTLLVASSDFTHFGPNYRHTPFADDIPSRIRERGDEAAAPILRCDFDGFTAHLAKTKDTICGRGPIKLLLRILSIQGGSAGVRTAFDTSGNITGDWTNSVTYQSFVFTPRVGTLEQPHRDALVKLACNTVKAYLNNQQFSKPPVDALPPALRADGACFVTLENHGRLRGCIGNMIATGPLYEAVIRNAISACRDRRFVRNPITAAELDEINVEISYLTPMKLLEDTDSIVVGRHGLMITSGARRGVLLPQVAGRRGWTRDEFLAQTCRKAGLPVEAWKWADTEIYSFEAEVFGEPEPTKHQ